MKYIIDLPDMTEEVDSNMPFEYKDNGICLCVYDPNRIMKIEYDEPFVEIGNIIIYNEDIAAVILDMGVDETLTILNENGCVEVIDIEEIDDIIGSTDLISETVNMLREILD